MIVQELISELQKLDPTLPLANLEVVRWNQYQVRYTDGTNSHPDYDNSEKDCREAYEAYKAEGATLHTRECWAIRGESALAREWKEVTE